MEEKSSQLTCDEASSAIGGSEAQSSLPIVFG